MPFVQSGELKYYTFPIFAHQEVIHAVFTRHGGLSPIPWNSLNFGASVGDDADRVIQNRKMALHSLNLSPQSVFDVFQVHSSVVVDTDRPLTKNETHRKGDAILTNKRKVSLMMRFADCVPILLYDPKKRVIGIVHSGWMGTVSQIARSAVQRMVELYKSKTSDILAGIGPSIGPDHYAVGKDVVDRVYTSLGEKATDCVTYKGDQAYLNLWLANQIILSSCGVENIEISEICTYCNNEDWYSHRGDHGKTGRFGVIFSLQP